MKIADTGWTSLQFIWKTFFSRLHHLLCSAFSYIDSSGLFGSFIITTPTTSYHIFFQLLNSESHIFFHFYFFICLFRRIQISPLSWSITVIPWFSESFIFAHSQSFHLHNFLQLDCVLSFQILVHQVVDFHTSTSANGTHSGDMLYAKLCQ